jgi:hypothetical protein
MKELANSFSSNISIESVVERIDLEMAVNLPEPSINMNCQYNFKPTNFDFLLLSRLAFA